MQDIIACNRMFRTAFWREQVGAFEGGIAYEDHVPMLTAYVRARTFDVLQKVTYHWRIREDLTSTGQQKARIANLRDRIAVKEQAHELLVAEASEAVYAAWVGRTLEVDFPPFLPHALAGRRGLPCPARRDLPDLPGPGDPPGLRDGPGGDAPARPPRRRGALGGPVRRGRLPARGAEHATDPRRRRAARRGLPSRVHLGGRAACRPPLDGSAGEPLRGRRRAPRVDRRGAPDHRVGLAARPGHAGASTAARPCRRGSSTPPPAAERIPLEVEQRRLPEADEWGPLANASPAGGGFVATADLTSLAAGELVRRGAGRAGRSRRGRRAARPGGPVGRRAPVDRRRWTGSASPPTGMPATGLTLHVTPGVAVDHAGRAGRDRGTRSSTGTELVLAGAGQRRAGGRRRPRPR